MRRRVLFDLDRTLWPCTVEYHPRLKLPRSTALPVLRYFQSQGAPLSVVSQSSEPAKCRSFVNTLFPGIRFQHVIVYPAEDKNSHVRAIGPPYDFITFDDDEDVLKAYRAQYPLCTTVHCDEPLAWKHVKLLHDLNIPLTKK